MAPTTSSTTSKKRGKTILTMTHSPARFMEHRIDKLRGMLENPVGSDMKIVCDGMSWQVHSWVLKLGSKVLGTMCGSLFKEGLEARIELKGHDPYLVYRMLQHLYLLNYSAGQIEITGVKEESFVSEFHTHVRLYAMGDEYDIPDLKKEVISNFKDAIKGNYSQVLHVVPAIYTTTPDSDRGLRDLVVEISHWNFWVIKDLPEFKIAVLQHPSYVLEILHLLEYPEDSD